MPAVRPALPAVPPRPDGPDRWPFADWGPGELLPMLLVPFGIVLLAQYLVVGFLGWTSDGARVLISAVEQLALLVPIVVWVRRTRGSLDRSLRAPPSPRAACPGLRTSPPAPGAPTSRRP